MSERDDDAGRAALASNLGSAMERDWAHFAEKWIAPKGDLFRQEMRMAFACGWSSILLRLAEFPQPVELARALKALAAYARKSLRAESKAAEARWPRPSAMEGRQMVFTPDDAPATREVLWFVRATMADSDEMIAQDVDLVLTRDRLNKALRECNLPPLGDAKNERPRGS